jgi:alcohol dehydrogenase, propanol-preferring
MRKSPVIPGHQVVGTVVRLGPGVLAPELGARVGIPWLHQSCGVCEYCLRGEENLCPQARFTGWDVDGGYAEYLIAEAAFVAAIPARFSDVEAAPLLCAGVIGYRSLRIAGVKPGDHVGLIGFGASARLAMQLLRFWDCKVSVFTRGTEHRHQALALGANWVGSADESPPAALDRAVLFAPAGELVPTILRKLRPAGTLAINAIHMSQIPSFDYADMYGERVVRSVSNATRQDAAEFLALAERIPLHMETQTFPLEETNRALQEVKAGTVRGAAVLLVAPENN